MGNLAFGVNPVRCVCHPIERCTTMLLCVKLAKTLPSNIERKPYATNKQMAVTAGVALGLLFGTAGLAAAQVPEGNSILQNAERILEGIQSRVQEIVNRIVG